MKKLFLYASSPHKPKKWMVNFSLSIKLYFLLFCFLISVNATAQVTPVNCTQGCTSNDVQIQASYLSNSAGVKLGSDFVCPLSGQATVYLTLELTTNTPRQGVAIFSNIKALDANGQPISPPITSLGECFGIILNQPTNKVTFQQPFTWSCGQAIALTDVFIGWGTGNKNFCTGTAFQCPATPSKCFQLPGGSFIAIETPRPLDNSATRCADAPGGSQATFNLSNINVTTSTNVTITWWENYTAPSTLTNPIATPASYTSISKTVYAKIANNADPSVFSVAMVTLNVNQVTAGAIAADQTICSGGDPTAFSETTAAIVSGTLTYQWQSSTGTCGAGSFANVSGATAALYDVPAGLTTTTTYRRITTSTLNNVVCTSISGCVTVTVKTLSTAPTSASTSINNFCSNAGGTLDLTATGGSAGTGAVIKWYSGSCGGTLVGTGNPLSINKPTTTTTYYARYEGDCNNTTCASVTVTVKTLSAPPSSASSSADNFCSNAGGTLNLTATGGTAGTGATIKWYSGSCGGTSIGTGSPLTINKPATTTTYYALYEGDCNTTACASVLVTVKTLSTAPTSASSSANNFCSDAGGTLDLTATGGAPGTGAVIKWYSGSCGGTSIGMGSPLTINKPATTTTYFARYEGDCNNTTCASVLVTVKTLSSPPTSASSSADNFCADAGGTLNLTATGGSLGTGAVVKWYSGSCGGTLVGTGNPLTINKPTTTTTYFARYEGDCNTTTCASVLVTVKTLSTAPTSASSSADNFCTNAGGTLNLSATGGSLGTGAVVKWYSGSCGGTPVGTGNPLTINKPTTTTTYYARYEGDCNFTGCASVLVTVNPLPAPPAVTYNAPACDEATFSLTVGSASFPILSGATYTVLDKNYQTIPGISPASPYTATAADVSANQIIFSNIPAGSGFVVTIESSSGCSPSNIPSPCGIGAGQRSSENSMNKVATKPVSSPDETVTLQSSVKAFPNPFSDKVKFLVTSVEPGRGTLDLFTINGQKIKTVYEGNIAAGMQVFEVSLPQQSISTLVYVFRIGDKQLTGKLIQLR